MSLSVEEALRSRIESWRAHALAQGLAEADVDALQTQLLANASQLADAGLDPDEAFLVGLKRSAETDASTRDFARTYAEELWPPEAASTGADASRTVFTSDATDPATDRAATIDFAVMLGCAIAAALAIKAADAFGYGFRGNNVEFFVRNLSLFVLPFLAAYFAWARKLSLRVAAVLGGVFVVGAVFVNAYPFASNGSTVILSAIHLPIALWFAVGVAFVGGEWNSDARRMEFVRFTGEWLVTYALIAMGGGVLIAITGGVFSAIGLGQVMEFVAQWVVPCGAAGAVIVAAWLVDGRRNIVGGMAPMLAKVFTPLFALMLVGLLAGVVWTRGFINIDRDALIFFDVLLVVVLALVLYAISARDPLARPGIFDRIQLVLVACALVVDVFALVNIAVRLTQHGLSPNRVAVIGLNLILLVNLVWSAYLQGRFVMGRGSFAALVRWQMRYLPVYPLWAALIVVVLPPLFRFA